MDTAMRDRTHNQEGEIEPTKAIAHLPGLDIELTHRQSPNDDWEQVSINLCASPSFEALGRFLETPNPFTVWVQTARLMWMPWLQMAQTMMLPDARQRTLPSAVRPQQEAPNIELSLVNSRLDFARLEGKIR